jgi:ribonuclease HI
MERTEIFTDGSYAHQTGAGGWAAVILCAASSRQPQGTSNEMELRTLIEEVKMADGSCTIISDQAGIGRLAQEGKTPQWCGSLWEELSAAAAGKDVKFEWRKRGQSLGQRLAHQFARDAARGR